MIRTMVASIAMLAALCASQGYCEPFNAIELGAKGDGIQDDGPAIQAAMDKAAQAGGGTVQLPAGTYLINDHLSVPSGVTLSGVWTAPHHSDQAWGSALHAVGHRGEENGPALIQLAPSAAVQGLTIYYPEQKFRSITPYPWTIQGRGMNGSVTDLTLVNAYQGIDFGTHANEMHTIRNVFGCVLRRGVYVDGCTDIGRIENVHFNPHFWMRAKTSGDGKPERMKDLIDYLNQNVEAFIFGRTDWEYVLNTFAFGFDKCYKFIQTERGACNGNFLGIGADGGVHALWVEATQPPGLLITNGEFVTFAGDKPVQVVTTETFKGVVQLSNCSFWGPTHRVADLQGDGFVSFQQCNFVQWALKGESVEAINAQSGQVDISHSRFGENKPQIKLGEGVKSAVIMGNTTRGEMRIANQSKGDVQTGMNVGRK